MIKDNSITRIEIDNNNVKSIVGDILAGSVEENKHTFDKLPELIASKHNGLVKELAKGGEPIKSREFSYIRMNAEKQLEVSTDGDKWEECNVGPEGPAGSIENLERQRFYFYENTQYQIPQSGNPLEKIISNLVGNDELPMVTENVKKVFTKLGWRQS